MDSKDVLTSEELDQLAEVREVVNTSSSAGWMRIITQMEKFVDESYEEMVGNISSDPMTYMRFQLRWQQREAMLRGVKHYVTQCQDKKTMILETTLRSVPLEEDYAEDRKYA